MYQLTWDPGEITVSFNSSSDGHLGFLRSILQIKFKTVGGCLESKWKTPFLLSQVQFVKIVCLKFLYVLHVCNFFGHMEYKTEKKKIKKIVSKEYSLIVL